MINKLNERLKYARKKIGLKQSEMAKKVGLSSYRSWQNYELGISDPNLDTLKKVADMADVPTSWLAFGEDSPNMRVEAIDDRLMEAAINEMEATFSGKNLSAKLMFQAVLETYKTNVKKQNAELEQSTTTKKTGTYGE